MLFEVTGVCVCESVCLCVCVCVCARARGGLNKYIIGVEFQVHILTQFERLQRCQSSSMTLRTHKLRADHSRIK